jgi:MoaA/NifB/PqqE/SkfB family radical SAM enzyme
MAKLRLSSNFARLKRRCGWLLGSNWPFKAINITLTFASYVLGLKKNLGKPVILKVDLSPNCNLKCTACVHADPTSLPTPDLRGQNFTPKQFMNPTEFETIISSCSPYLSAVSLYYLGDPLIHPQLSEFIRIANAYSVNTHVNTNFSFVLSDSRIESLVTSGLTHFTACMDGFTQETYSKTRVNGNIDLVKNNLKRLIEYKIKHNSNIHVEVQYLSFDHNRHEVDLARNFCRDLGPVTFTIIRGYLNNYCDTNEQYVSVLKYYSDTLLPKCFWPYFSTVIKYNGDVIPCCFHRMGEAYSSYHHNHSLGNVIQTSVTDVWNSISYQNLRKAMKHPKYIKAKDSSGISHFCDGCNVVCQRKTVRNVSGKNWDAIYSMNDKGIPIAKI